MPWPRRDSRTRRCAPRRPSRDAPPSSTTAPRPRLGQVQRGGQAGEAPADHCDIGALRPFEPGPVLRGDRIRPEAAPRWAVGCRLVGPSHVRTAAASARARCSAARLLTSEAVTTPRVTIAMSTVESALISGETPSRMEEKTVIGSVVAPGPVVKEAMTRVEERQGESQQPAGEDGRRDFRQGALQHDQERHQEQRPAARGDGTAIRNALRIAPPMEMRPGHSSSTTQAVVEELTQTGSSQVMSRRATRPRVGHLRLDHFSGRQLDVTGRDVAQTGDIRDLAFQHVDRCGPMLGDGHLEARRNRARRCRASGRRSR